MGKSPRMQPSPRTQGLVSSTPPGMGALGAPLREKALSPRAQARNNVTPRALQKVQENSYFAEGKQDTWQQRQAQGATSFEADVDLMAKRAEVRRTDMAQKKKSPRVGPKLGEGHVHNSEYVPPSTDVSGMAARAEARKAESRKTRAHARMPKQGHSQRRSK